MQFLYLFLGFNFGLNYTLFIFKVGGIFSLYCASKHVIIITFYSISCLGQETAKGFLVFESSCHLPICLPNTVEASHCPV